MLTLKPQFILTALLCLVALSIQAQQPALTGSGKGDKFSVDPSSSWALDSLHKLNEMRLGINRISTIPGSMNSPIAEKSLPQSLRTRVSKQKSATVLEGKRVASSVCYNISGRNFLYQDSLILYTGDPTITSDGNVIVSGQYADYSKLPLSTSGFCMKTDPQGNVIWTKLFDSTVNVNSGFLNFFRSVELGSGALLLAGRTENRVSGNSDFVLAKLDNNGNLIWLKTYESRLWKGFSGSGDLFGLRDLEEDPMTGELYFVGYHWEGLGTITKLTADGSIVWSNTYDTWDTEYPFGIVINRNDLFLFQLGNGYYNQSYINVTAIDKLKGDTLYSKQISQKGDRNAARLFSTYEVVKNNNGHFLLSGPTTRGFEYPAYTGTVDLYHAGIIELDENLNYVKAYGFKNRVDNNFYNTRISLFPNGSGVFTMVDVKGSYTAEARISLFRNELIYHQRKRLHKNEGLPYEPFTRQLPDGRYLNIKLMGDSTKKATAGSRLDYYRMHPSDTSSVCLGLSDAATSLWYFDFEPVNTHLSNVQKNIFKESRVKTFDNWNFKTTAGPACQVISNCDTLALQVDTTTVCAGKTVVLKVFKEGACGSAIPLVYDTTWVSSVTRLSDTTYALQFKKAGSGYITGSLMGCELIYDSVYIEVLPAILQLDLGKDTTICPGNQVKLNARKGFASYKWQDGSTDSTFISTKPGIYSVAAVNSCGTIFYDTIEVKDHPPVPISIGSDRTKCDRDTIQLSAPLGFISYTWSNNYKISSLSSQSVVVNPLVDTSYFIKAEKTPGCFAFDTVRVKVYTSPPIQLGSDRSFCIGDSTVFNGGGGFQSYLWSTGETSQYITARTVGSYSVVAATAEGCLNSDTVRVLSVNPLPLVKLEKDISICAGESKVLTAGNFISYHWSNGATTSSIKINSVGSFKVRVSDANGCFGEDSTVLVAVHPRPKDFLPSDTLLCSYSSIELVSNPLYTQHLWSTGAVSSRLRVTKPGLYWLETVDRNNCRGRDSIVISPKDCMKGFYMPSGFTPNNDNRNDEIKPLLFGIVIKYRFNIYNRWGEVVFSSSELQKGWNGRFGGILQRSDVFIWTCTYQLEGGKEEIEKGALTLIQ